MHRGYFWAKQGHIEGLARCEGCDDSSSPGHMDTSDCAEGSGLVCNGLNVKALGRAAGGVVRRSRWEVESSMNVLF